MRIGYNHDISYRHHVVHVQTEDRAPRQLAVESHLFLAGQVLDSQVVDYAEAVAALDAPACAVHVQALMRECHRSLVRRLLAGAYDDLLP